MAESFDDGASSDFEPEMIKPVSCLNVRISRYTISDFIVEGQTRREEDDSSTKAKGSRAEETNNTQSHKEVATEEARSRLGRRKLGREHAFG